MPELVMVFDTETSDKGRFWGADALPYNHDDQPHLVQLGFKVYTKQRDILFEMGILVDSTQHHSWKGINPDAQNVHGISEDLLRIYGTDPEKVASHFQKWAEKCDTFVAHNKDFDIPIVQCFMYRSGYSPDVFSTGAAFCTMKYGTNICKVPNRNGRGGYKWPTLMEAYCALIDNRGFKNAHNALADVNPCADLFWNYVDQGYIGWDSTGAFYAKPN